MTRLVADWLTAPATQAVCGMLEAGGHKALIVGGAVRNTLMGLPVKDVDIATDAHPDRVIDLGAAAGMKVVPTGIAHGTVTVVAGGRGFEVTTFRRDVATDGRRAEVAFGASIEEDARRRDFTMNALYADRHGTLLDPMGGLDDIAARRVRFIDDPQARIVEDYLRSLRFFRFHAIYGDPDQGIDPEALAAIAANLDGLDGLSRERVGGEMMRLLGAGDPAPAVAAMRSVGVLRRLLPGCDDRALAPLVAQEALVRAAPEAVRRLAALGGDATEVAQALRLSRRQSETLRQLHSAVGSSDPATVLGYRLGARRALDAMLLRAAMLGSPLPPDAQAQVRMGARAQFPLTAADLMPGLQGPALGAKLKALERRWIDSGFALDRAALLNRARDD